MQFIETDLKGAYIIDLSRIEDERGFFARAWCREEFIAHGLNPSIAQINVGYSRKRGTIRGLHYQRSPGDEAKLVRCTRGAMQAVIVDLRRDSPTHRQWVSFELTQTNCRMIYVPEGFAHGYQTLADDTEMCYQTSQVYSPTHASGVRFDDPAFGIKWPLAVEVISIQDKSWPQYS